jgi:hypothetical protein
VPGNSIIYLSVVYPAVDIFDDDIAALISGDVNAPTEESVAKYEEMAVRQLTDERTKWVAHDWVTR